MSNEEDELQKVKVVRAATTLFSYDFATALNACLEVLECTEQIPGKYWRNPDDVPGFSAVNHLLKSTKGMLKATMREWHYFLEHTEWNLGTLQTPDDGCDGG